MRSTSAAHVMLNFTDYNDSGDCILEEFECRLPLLATGLPKGFAELPIGHFVYMIETGGQIRFISHGLNPWSAAESMRRKHKGARILYCRTTVSEADALVKTLLRRYSARHSVDVRPERLVALDMLVDGGLSE